MIVLIYSFRSFSAIKYKKTSSLPRVFFLNSLIILVFLLIMRVKSLNIITIKGELTIARYLPKCKVRVNLGGKLCYHDYYYHWSR